ncbi:DUF5050 domain-containing protein [Patescibacteria group bacterium]|nr:DUF5050 domain-containing protein [Patescibacteria group bacterium]MBU1673517.1 DUF5050 domain-containing protein [Patescibacteria group bacterium]MBU1963701.1 DUF5050 domain-containing protein [Patescibacteria group bacterium]
MKKSFYSFIIILAITLFLGMAESALAANKVYYGHEQEMYATTHYPIYQMNTDGSKNKELLIDGLELFSPEGLAIAPNGTTLSWAEPAGVFGIVLMDSNGSDTRYLEDWGLGIDHMVSWNPNSKKIIFIRENTELGEIVGHIYMARKDGEKVTMLVVPSVNQKSQYNPSYSPSGKRVVFEGVNQKGKHNIFTIKPDGSGLKKLTKCKSGCYEPRYSPNGKRIAYVKKDGKKFQLYTMKKDGMGKKQLTTKAKARTPFYTPSGKKIYYAFKKKGESDFEIYSIRLKDQKKKRLTNNSVDDLRPTVGEIK